MITLLFAEQPGRYPLLIFLSLYNGVVSKKFRLRGKIQQFVVPWIPDWV